MELNEIKSLAKKKRYDEALAACDDLLNKNPNQKVDVLRTRAYVLARSGNYQQAVKDREALINMGEAVLRDYYLAADNALSSGSYELASTWFEKVLRLSEEQNEEWFLAASYFLCAYSQMQLGKLDEATEYLDKAIALEPDCTMPLPGLGMWDCARLKQEIKQRR